MQKFFSFIAGIMSGALIGAVAAILFTPASGDELLGDTRVRADQLIEDMKANIAGERKRLESELEALKKGEIQVS